MNKHNTIKNSIKFDERISADLDKAITALESKDHARQELGKIWKRKLEKRIWEDNNV